MCAYVNFQWGLQRLNLPFGQHHSLIYFMNLLKEVSDFVFCGSSFDIFGLKAIKLLLPQIGVLWLLSTMPFGCPSAIALAFWSESTVHETLV